MTSVQGDGDGQRTAGADTILLVMEAGRNRELLTEWLDSLSRYETETAATPAEMPEEYDLCLLAVSMLDDFREELVHRREQSGAVFLPHILVVTDTETTDPQQYLSADLETLFDDVFQFPLEKALLQRRLDNSLRTRQASVSLAAREQQYRNLVELTPETILLVQDETIVYANTAASRLFDTDTTQEVEGRSLLSFVDPADEAIVRDVLVSSGESSDETGTDFVEVPMKSTSGRELYVSMAGVEVESAGRTMTQLIIRDLTTEKQRKQRLNLFGRVMESAAQGITIVDANQSDYPLIYANRGFERITGYPVSEVLGENCRLLQGDNTDQKTTQKIRTAIKNETAVSVDILNYRHDGTPFWNRLDIVPVEDANGEVTHFLGLQRDVTTEKEREQQLSVLNRVLRHNLRNKMNIIQVYADQLQELPEASDAATSIANAAGELLTISEQIRKFDSIVGADERDLRPLDLAELITSGVEALRHRNPDADIDLSAPDEAVIRAHETLAPALTDLVTLTNAIDEPNLDIDITAMASAVEMTIVDRSGAMNSAELEIVAGEGETQLEHLESLELWLIRWAVVESHGEFLVDTTGTNPELTLRFQPANESA